ncbi:MAG: 50S ribosomal protein L29 [Planctomycetota bacterium]|jgi:large subunit ribosomal protein L29|nr:50S ribosomal protein L29 [Planctomycetota bacterium]MDP6990104.1 50S ribosomal protein L29 [Planctomycetota bacterium]
MNIDEARGKTDSELSFDLEQMKKELFELRMKASMENIANPARIRVLRRAIARARTILHERSTGVRGQEPR